jgi:hypothetical protein
LRSFQIDHAVRIISEFSPFLAIFSAPRTAHRHRSWNTFESCDGARNVWWTLVCKLLYEGFIVLYNGPNILYVVPKCWCFFLFLFSCCLAT